MPEVLKAALSLLSGRMAGSNNKASFVVHGLRFAYISTGGVIAIAWYSGWRNERIPQGSFKYPIPGVGKLTAKYSINRPDGKLAEAPEGPQHKEFGTSTNETTTPTGTSNPHSSPAIGTGESSGKTSAVPQTPAAAKRLSGIARLDGHPVDRWIIPYLLYARNHGWKGKVENGYRSYAEQYRIYYIEGIRPAAIPGTSNHEGKAFPKGAVDVSEAAQLSAILEKMPGGSLLKWAGSADPVHFSYPHNGSY